MSAIGAESDSRPKALTPDGNARRIRTWHLAMIVGAIALAIFAIGYWIPAYRYDEYLVAVARADLSWRQLVRHIVTADPAPGAWYVLMKAWATVSSDSTWTRIPS